MPRKRTINTRIELHHLPIDIFTGREGLAKFTDGFFFDVSGLAKFVSDFWTADATGRSKFADGIINNPLVTAGIQAAKILLTGSTFLNFWQWGTDPTKIDVAKLHRTETIVAQLVPNTLQIGTKAGLPITIPALGSSTLEIDLGTDNNYDRMYYPFGRCHTTSDTFSLQLDFYVADSPETLYQWHTHYLHDHYSQDVKTGRLGCGGFIPKTKSGRIGFIIRERRNASVVIDLFSIYYYYIQTHKHDYGT